MNIERPPTQAQADSIHPFEFLIALGNDPRYSYHRREHPWYGLWLAVLYVFHAIPYCQLFPQYVIWKVETGEDAGSEYQHSPGSKLDPRRNKPLLPVIPRTPVNTEQYRPIYSTSPWTATPSTPPQREISQSLLPRPRRQKVFYGVVKKNVQQNENVRPLSSDSESPSDSGSDSDTSTDDDPFNPLVLHKIPDFSISHTSGRRQDPTLVSRRPNVIIERRIIALLVEIKHYRSVGDDHDSERSRERADSKLTDAMKDLKLQIEFLFSPHFVEGKQSAVIGIAASGFFWSYVQCINKDGKPVLNMARHLRSSRKYEIGTAQSNIMLERIFKWVRNLINNPDATNFAILEDA